MTFSILSTGCAATQEEKQANRAVDDYFRGDYAAAQRQLDPLSRMTDQNFVLNNVRLGSAALVDYNLPVAEDSFTRAYEVINSVGVNDGGRSLGAVLVNEKIKIWKGEPFERAMANFYLGLIYYMKADYNNARAAFENSLFKLRDYGEGKDQDDQYQRVESNFALAYLMLGHTWQRLGEEDKARKDLARAVELRSYLAPLADYELNKRSNLLLVIDFGHGPEKITNRDGAIVGFGPTPNEVGPVPPPAVTIDGRPIDLRGIGRPPVDLLALAQDRRWQDIDTIRTIKSTVGTGLIAAGAIYGGASRSRNAGVTGLALAGAGLLLKGTSQADVRQWEMLPRTTFILPIEVEPGTHDVTIDFPNAPGHRQTWRGLVVPPQGEATYYFRTQRYREGPFNWPPPALAGSAGIPAPADPVR